MTMSDREKKAWSLAAKVLVVAIPAAISGVVSYAKARLESKEESSAAYVTLKGAVEKLQNERNQDSMHIQYLAAEVEKCRNGGEKSLRFQAEPDPEMHADGGFPAVSVRLPRLNLGRVALMADLPENGPLPDTLDLAVKQVQMRKAAK